MAQSGIPHSSERLRRFYGEYVFLLDAKGRASIPAKMREVVELSELTKMMLRVMTFENFTFLRAYPINYYDERILSKLENIEGETPAETFRIWRLTASCQEVKIDKQGRMNIPGELLKKVGITRNICFVGMGDYIDIWEPEAYKEFFQAQMMAYEKEQAVQQRASTPESTT